MLPFKPSAPAEDSRVPDAILARAQSDPRTFVAHVAEHGGLLVSWCMTCRQPKGVIEVEGRPGISDGLHEGRCAAAYLAWMRGETATLQRS
jgi:hypothetical protein